MTSSTPEPTPPLTDDELSNVRTNLEMASHWRDPWDVVPNYRAVSGLVAKVDQLQRTLAKVEEERDAAMNRLEDIGVVTNDDY